MNFVKPREMTEDDILEMIKAFGAAAKRAVEAGADAVQLHAAHGYLISEFLSPFFNVRTDSWGGSAENRFRFLKEICKEVKKVVPDGFPVLVKLNTNDYTPKEGITATLAAKYAGWLAGLGIDGVEVSCGTTNYSFMNMLPGRCTYAGDLAKALAWYEKPIARHNVQKNGRKIQHRRRL